MRHEKKLTDLQLIALIQAGIISISIISMPFELANESGNDAWISITLCAAISIIFAFGVAKLSLLYPNDTMVEYFPKVYGKIIGYFLDFILLGYLTLSVSLNSRIFSNIITINLLPNTPNWTILLFFYIIVAYWIISGIRVLSLSVTILMFPFLIAFSLLLLLATPKIKLDHLLPIVSNGITPIAKGTLKAIPYFFGFATLGFIVPVLKEPKKIYKNVIIGILIPFILFIFLMIILIARFSVEEVKTMVFPVITLIRNIKLPGTFIERLESLFFIVFIPLSLDNGAIYFYLVILGLVRLTKKPYYNVYILIISVIAFTISLLPENMIKTEQMMGYLTYIGLFFIFLVIPIGILITLIKRRYKKE